MFELNKFVIPKVMAHCKDLTYNIRYSIGDVQAFNKDGRDGHEHCQQLLTTGHGPTPKNQTLLKYIKKVDELTAASEERGAD